ncbi:hypothetical protein ADUPG1_009015, partial [Aduncisulcus paluster]
MQPVIQNALSIAKQLESSVSQCFLACSRSCHADNSSFISPTFLQTQSISMEDKKQIMQGICIPSLSLFDKQNSHRASVLKTILKDIMNAYAALTNLPQLFTQLVGIFDTLTVELTMKLSTQPHTLTYKLNAQPDLLTVICCRLSEVLFKTILCACTLPAPKAILALLNSISFKLDGDTSENQEMSDMLEFCIDFYSKCRSMAILSQASKNSFSILSFHIFSLIHTHKGDHSSIISSPYSLMLHKNIIYSSLCCCFEDVDEDIVKYICSSLVNVFPVISIAPDININTHILFNNILCGGKLCFTPQSLDSMHQMLLCPTEATASAVSLHISFPEVVLSRTISTLLASPLLTDLSMSTLSQEELPVLSICGISGCIGATTASLCEWLCLRDRKVWSRREVDISFGESAPIVSEDISGLRYIDACEGCWRLGTWCSSESAISYESDDAGIFIFDPLSLPPLSLSSPVPSPSSLFTSLSSCLSLSASLSSFFSSPR